MMRGALTPATGQPDEVNQPDEVGVIRGDDLTPPALPSTVIDADGVVAGSSHELEVRIGVFRLAGVQPLRLVFGLDRLDTRQCHCMPRVQIMLRRRVGQGGWWEEQRLLCEVNRGLDAHKAPMGALEPPNTRSSPPLGTTTSMISVVRVTSPTECGSCSGMKRAFGKGWSSMISDRSGIESHGINLPPVAQVRPIPQGDRDDAATVSAAPSSENSPSVPATVPPARWGRAPWVREPHPQPLTTARCRAVQVRSRAQTPRRSIRPRPPGGRSVHRGRRRHSAHRPPA